MIARRISCALSLLLIGTAVAACGGGGSADRTKPPVVIDPTIPAPSVPSSIVLNRSSLQFNSVGATQTLSAEVRDQNGSVMTAATVTWSVSDARVATVSAAGTVTAIAAGNTAITARAGSATVNINVVIAQKVASVVVTPSTVTLQSIGATQQLIASIRDSSGSTIEGTSVVWVASPSSVATVSSSGVVTALASGSATVSATVQNVMATVPISVQGTAPPVSCTTRPLFEEFLIDPSLLKVVTQIGVIGGANTELVGRSYAFPVDGMDGVRMALNAPTALNVVAAKHYLPPGAPTVGYVPDWSLVLDTGCGLTIELFHVKDVAASIKAVADTTISSSSAWQPLPARVPFRAGETFGWYQRGLNSVAFDVIAHDNTAHNHFANQRRYDTGGSNLLDIVCPWTLFAPAKRDAYLGIVGAPTGQRVAGAGCGTVERDVAGTPAGQWFRSQSIPASWPFAKDGNYGDPLPIILGIDNTVYVGHTGPSNDIRIERNNATWKDPSTITTAHCYQITSGSTSSGWLWLRMNSATQMDVSYSYDGLCPVSFPASGYVSYHR